MHEDKAPRAELFPSLRTPSLLRAENRDASLDIARGFAMILVVFGHALVGALGAGLISENTERLLTAIYAVHMPLFFMISGFLAPRMIAQPLGVFAGRFWSRLVWPYLLWSLVLITAHYVMRAYTNTSMDGFHPYTILWKPPAVMWFLYYLAIAILIARAVRTLLPGFQIAAAVTIICAPYLLPDLPDQTRFIGFFLLGIMIPRDWMCRTLPAVWFYVATLVFLACILLLWILPIDNSDAYPASQIWLLPAAIVGPFLIFGFSKYVSLTLPDVGLFRLIEVIGQNTMPIFVLHILITAGTRIVLLKMGIANWTTIIFTATVLGLFIPLVVGQMAARAGIGKCLGWR